MASDRTLKTGKADAFVKHLEEQGCRVRRTKRGYMVYTPDGSTLSTHTTMGDIRGMKNDIAQFRRAGVHHPDDPKPLEQEKEMVETTSDGYPVYITKPITSTTRKVVLADLESKGWPLVVKASDISMDTTTAQRALYNVGYRWHNDDEGKRNRVWHAPREIVELHTKAKEEAERRESEARERRNTLRLLPTSPPSPDPAIAAIRVPSPKEVHDNLVGHGGRAEEAERLLNEAMVERKTPPEGVIAGPPATATSSGEREFVDDVDSWVVDLDSISQFTRVQEYVESLRTAGLNVEIRVWRA